jgi:hypothetical protein
VAPTFGIQCATDMLSRKEGSSLSNLNIIRNAVSL